MSRDAGVFPLRPRRRPGGLEHGGVRGLTRGAGSEVAGSRAYVPGDDVRTVDWPASARLSSARGSTELVVRETYADRAPRVLTVLDRRPSMALYPSPWLAKPAVAATVESLVGASARAAGALRGRLRLTGEGPLYDAPAGHEPEPDPDETQLHLAAPDALTVGLQFLAGARGLVPGAVVFVVSDFLEPPPPSAWAALVSRGLDPVPVVVQDPVWESGFPLVGGVVLPFCDPRTGRPLDVGVGRRGAARRAAAHAARLETLLREFDDLGLDHVRLSTADPARILDAFTDWADVRHATSGWTW